MKKLILIAVLSLGILCGCYDRENVVGEFPAGTCCIPTGTQVVAAYGRFGLLQYTTVEVAVASLSQL